MTYHEIAAVLELSAGTVMSSFSTRGRNYHLFYRIFTAIVQRQRLAQTRPLLAINMAFHSGREVRVDLPLLPKRAAERHTIRTPIPIDR